jgi:Tol biopolymer transport system component
VSDTLAAVLARDPDWSAIPEATPARVRELIARCLVKDPKRRLRDVGEARIELENALDSRTSSGTLRVPAPVTPRAPLTLALGAVAVAAVAFAAWAFLRPAPAAAPAPVTRLHVERPPGELNTGTGTFALSPDGRAVVFVVLGNTDTPRLWVRELDDPAGRDLPGTEGAALPFWSPDARDIAFFADGKLKRVPRSGGGVRTVCEAANARGGAWGASGVIIFSANPFGPLFKVAADGGVPEPATTLDAARKQDSHRFPSFLPDGRGFVYAVLPQVEQGLMQNEIASLDDPSGKPLLLASNAARYAPPGYMLFARDQALMAQRIDLATGRMEGEIIPLADRPELFPRITGTPGVDCAADGTIVYDETDRRATDAVWMSRDGRRLEKAFTHPGAVIGGFLAPRGDRLVLGSIGDPDLSIVVVDLATGSETRVVRPDRRPRGFAWSPVDGRLLLYVRDGDGESIASVDPDGGPERIVLPLGRRYAIPSTAAPDGTIVLNELVAGGRYDIVYLPRGEGTETRAYLATDANEEESVLSPDGGLLAYTSDASGRTEVYVDAFPAHREARRVSSGGGSLPRWRRDGRELYFLSANGRNLLACDVTVSPSFALGTPRALFELPQDVRSILPAPKGDKFLMLVPVGPPRTALTVVQNWSAQLD